jgi:hypothetical protein
MACQPGRDIITFPQVRDMSGTELVARKRIPELERFLNRVFWFLFICLLCGGGCLLFVSG